MKKLWWLVLLLLGVVLGCGGGKPGHEDCKGKGQLCCPDGVGLFFLGGPVDINSGDSFDFGILESEGCGPSGGVTPSSSINVFVEETVNGPLIQGGNSSIGTIQLLASGKTATGIRYVAGTLLGNHFLKAEDTKTTASGFRTVNVTAKGAAAVLDMRTIENGAGKSGFEATLIFQTPHDVIFRNLRSSAILVNGEVFVTGSEYHQFINEPGNFLFEFPGTNGDPTSKVKVVVNK